MSLLCFYLMTALSASGQGPKVAGWTDTDHPDYITKVTDFGERADWSPDGKTFLFVARSFGDVYEFDLATKRYKALTHHYYHRIGRGTLGSADPATVKPRVYSQVEPQMRPNN